MMEWFGYFWEHCKCYKLNEKNFEQKLREFRCLMANMKAKNHPNNKRQHSYGSARSTQHFLKMTLEFIIIIQYSLKILNHEHSIKIIIITDYFSFPLQRNEKLNPSTGTETNFIYLFLSLFLTMSPFSFVDRTPAMRQ